MSTSQVPLLFYNTYPYKQSISIFLLNTLTAAPHKASEVPHEGFPPHSPFISTEWQITHTRASFRSMYSSLHLRLQQAAQNT